MADNKSVQELMIQVRRRGIKPATKEVEALSEALNDAAIFTDDLNKSLSNIKVPASMTSLTGSFEKFNDVLEYIESNTFKASETLDAVLDQLGENADAARADILGLSEEVQDLNKNSIATGNAVQKLDTNVRGVGESFEQTEGQARRVNNRLKDINRQGTNSVRTFSDMARSSNSIVNAYALVAANVFAVTEAFRLLNEAASVDRLEEVSAVMSGQLGISIIGVAEALQEATDGAVSYQAALRQAASATAFGFDTQTISEFATVARRASIVLGVEMTDALNRVVRGVSKAEVELLDELGITVRLNEAFAQYAAEHNIAANSLNSFQRQQALANEVIRKSEQNLGAVDSRLESTAWEKFGANVSGATNRLLRLISTNDIVIGTLNEINGVFEAIDRWGREGADSLPVIDTLKEARVSPGFIDDMLALNGLLEEQEKLDKRLRKAARAANNAAPGQVGPLEDEVRALKAEYLLATKAVNEFTKSMGTSKETAKAIAPEIQNLTTLSRSLSGGITGIINDLTPEKGTYAGLANEAKEAQRSVNLLTEAGISQREALERLKITSEQFYKLDAIQAYAKIQENQTKEMQKQEMLAKELDGLTSFDEAVLVAEQQLEAQRKINDAATAVLGIKEKTTQMVYDEWVLEQKLNAAQAKSIQNSYEKLRIQSEFENRNQSTFREPLDSTTTLQRELSLEMSILETMQRQEFISKAEIEAQKERTKELERQLIISREENSRRLRQDNQQGVDSTVATLSPEISDIQGQVLAAADAWEVYGQSAKSAGDLAAASATTTASALNSISSVIQMAGQAAVGSIDAEIAALQSKENLSEAEEKKLKELNKKKIKEQEKYAKSTILIQTAAGIAYALGSAPPPISFINAGLVAVAGAMAYQQASNSAASQLAALGNSTNEGADPTSLKVGEANDMKVDVSSSASAAERAESLGDRGFYGRASSGNMYKDKSYLVGETGTEVVTPKVDSVITPTAEENEKSAGAMGRAPTILQIEALDAASILDRADEIIEALEEGANQSGRSIVRDA